MTGKIKALRERTGAGILECRKALVAVGGDLDAAIEALRTAGFKPKAGRIAAEGAVFAATNSTSGALVEINCETDFVALTDAFQMFGRLCAEVVVDYNPASPEALLDLVREDFEALSRSSKETIQIRRFRRFELGG